MNSPCPDICKVMLECGHQAYSDSIYRARCHKCRDGRPADGCPTCGTPDDDQCYCKFDAECAP